MDKTFSIYDLLKEAFPDWRLSILNRYSPPAELTQAYTTWKAAWNETGPSDSKAPATDAFTETDAATVLFYGDICAGLILHKLVDIREDIWRDDQHFAHWPKNTLDTLMKNGSKVLVCSHFTVNENFREGGRYHFSFAVKDLLVGVSFRYFLSTPAQAMTGNLHRAKDFQRIFYKWGATPLLTGMAHQGEVADLVAVYRDSVNLDADPFLAAFVGKVWSDRENALRPREIAPLILREDLLNLN